MRVLGVGHCTLDFIGVVDRFVEPDFKKEFTQFSTQGGGAAATAVVALSRWGVETGFVGKVGSDPRGDEIERTLAQEGVDTRGLVHQPEAVSQMSFIVVEQASGRKNTYMTGGSVAPLRSDEVDLGVLDGATVLLCDSTHPEAELRLVGRDAAPAYTAALRELTERAREGRLSPAELTGGTFTLNNYGVFGVDGSTPIINHPEVAILGIGRIIDRPWVVDGQLAVRKVTQLSLAFDHRVCDGGTAGGFLRFVADCVESPITALADL